MAYPTKKELYCRGCGAYWKNISSSYRVRCPYCGKTKDARIRPVYAYDPAKRAERLRKLKIWAKENAKAKHDKDESLLRKRVFFLVSGGPNAKCVRCGCDDWRVLEVNHKNGGGNREHETGRYARALYHDIMQRRRTTEDLEILCRPCNAIHYLEMKFGPLPIRVVWDAVAR